MQIRHPLFYRALALLSAAAAATIVLYGLSLTTKSRHSHQWPTTTGIITDASLHKFRYTYRVADTDYTGHRITFGESASSNTYESRIRGGSLKPGQTVTVHYHPQHPADSTLHPGYTKHITLLLGFGTALGLLSLIGFFTPIQIKT